MIKHKNLEMEAMKINVTIYFLTLHLEQDVCKRGVLLIVAIFCAVVV